MIILDHTYNNAFIKYSFTDKYLQDVTKDCRIKMDTEWDNLVKVTEAKGGKVWDSDIYRITGISEGGYLHISLDKIRYKDMKGARTILPELISLDDSYQPHGGIVASIIRSKSGDYIVGNLPSSSVLTLKTNLIGGSMNIDEVPFDENFSIHKFIENELFEELGVVKEYIKESNLIGIIQTKNHHFVFVFFIDLLLSSEEILQSHKKLEEKEFQSIEILPKSELIGKLSEIGDWQGKIHLLKSFQHIFSK